ncbi:GNAT family N-acetyltransferase [Nocardioides sp. GXZ039]|uniref:GNAT family N-acetyltransferase n=1 Tax=Nocardioides sp. GXZ039 TaxID=3136018 RepID=UPI0030F39F87
MEIRLLDLADSEESYRLGVEAFGPPRPGAPPFEVPAELPPGRHVWGAFDRGRLVGRVAGLEFESWWHGRRVPTCGVASVAIAPEHRGRGLLRPLFAAMLEQSAERGEVVSALYPTAHGIYRGLGYEIVTSYDTVELPTTEAALVPRPEGIEVRRAATADVPAIRALYDTWAAAQNGPLTRTGPRFGAGDAGLLDDFTGVSVAVDPDDRVLGFASWDRTGGYDASGRIEVWDLLGATGDAYRALWAMLGTNRSATGSVSLRTSGHDPARLALPSAAWPVTRRHSYMLRLDHPAAAIAAVLGGHAGGSDPIALTVLGDRLRPEPRHLVLDPREGTCVEVADQRPATTFTASGIALLYAGVQNCANLRLLGLLSGPSEHDGALDAIFTGRPVHIRDYF